ncbi:MAG: hypothetical protein O9264_11945 [Leptospira sp.]|nr:hypothetical protein [Leptospira sp.]
MNVRCGHTTEEMSNEATLLLIASSSICESERRKLYEPNDDFNQATCVDKSLGNLAGSCSFGSTTIYPPSDLDYFRVTLNSGSSRVYIGPDSYTPSSRRVSFQFYDKNQSLIFDPEDTKFNSVSATILENRFLTKDDCETSQCSDFITKYRMIRFDPSIQQIYIKFFPVFPEIFQEGDGSLILVSTAIDRPVNPRNFGTYVLQGDIKPCN